MSPTAALLANIIAAIIVGVLMVHVDAAPPQGTIDSAIAAWFEGLRAPSGAFCCAEADGHILADEDWRTRGDGYEFRALGRWYPVPPAAVLAHVANPTGGAVVFFTPDAPWNVYCFVRPAET